MDLLEWGKRRDYPALFFPPYAIGPGEYCWRMFCGLAKPAALAKAGEYIAEIDKSQGIDAQTSAQADISQKGA